MRYLFLAIFAVSSIAADGCSPAPAPRPIGTVDARAACARGAELGCASLGPTPAGKPCLEWLSSAPVSSAYLGCIVAAPDCPSAEACR